MRSSRTHKERLRAAPNKVPPHFANPPGYVPVQANVAMLRSAEHPLSAFRKSASVEGAIEAGIIFAGTPIRCIGRSGNSSTTSAGSAIC